MSEDWKQQKRELCPLISPEEWQALEDVRRPVQIAIGLLLLNELRAVREELERLRGDVQDVRDAVRRGTFSG